MIPRTDPFVPAEWNEFFAQIDPSARNQWAAELCAHLIAVTGLSGATTEKAIGHIANGVTDGHVLNEVMSLVRQCEKTNDELTEEKPGQLPLDHPDVTAAFRKMVAMHALRLALERRFADLVYEAIHTLDDDRDVIKFFPH
ncbi:MAG: hypothetical protein KDA86_07430 [Planctomycetaceae bacterium]|nr:hypothetical protein [Planctomycetaceae bacterium]MCA9110733.1 hypothetical protein [Planctomycetaceae bacterium]